MQIEQSRKAGIASGLARQSPELTAHKAKAIELHKTGLNTGQINQAMPGRQRNEIRRWLIAAGIYQTKGRGKANAGQRRFNAVKMMADGFSRETEQVAKMGDCGHWRRHPALKAKPDYGEKQRAAARAWSKANWRKHHLKIILSNRIRSALRKQSQRKAGKTTAMLGCSIPELRMHLESTFKPGMGWHNHGVGPGQWHIDHVKPCQAFDLAKPEDVTACFHWSNLQALWGKENIRKSDSY